MPSDFSGLRATFVNCSLTQDGSQSHTMKLVRRSVGIMRDEGVEVDVIHALDHFIAFGMEEDLGQAFGRRDEWPELQARIMAADILVLATPIWLGFTSSVLSLVIERLYAYSSETNDNGQYIYYGKAGGCMVTGNEDGVKACSRDILFALQHIGYTIPPQADCGWIGEIGPGPSYGDNVEGSDTPVGYDHEFTNQNVTYMTWNLMHLARMLRDAGGYPARGNTVEWREVSNAADQNPEAPRAIESV
jgi:multimeric flavodoxin WrbA